MDALKLVKNEVGVSKHLHLTHLNEPTMFELDNGQIGCTLRLSGVPFDTASNDRLNQYKRTLHQAICQLGESYCFYQTTLRRRLDVALENQFPDEFTETVDKLYHAQFQATPLYANELYITVLYKGVELGKLQKPFQFLQTLLSKAMKEEREAYRSQSIALLKKSVKQLMASLSDFHPRLLGEQDASLGYSELLTFYGVFVNGLAPVHLKKPQWITPMAKALPILDQVVLRYPEGNLSQYLPIKQLFFGEAIEFRGANQQSTYGAMISLKTYGTETASIMLDPLLHLDCEFITTNSFAIKPNDAAQSNIVKQLVRMENANDPAVSQMEQLVQCRDDLASGRLRVGYHHHSLMLLSDDLAHLQTTINKAIKLYSDVGIVAIQETLGQEPAFWAQLPGNQQYIVRANLITSQNFVDFCPLHNYRTGYRDQNHLGTAVTLIETPSKTPLFFNYHSQGSGDKNDLTPGHTTIIGGNGSGKTVFMGFMDSQMSRYGGRSFFFDRDRGLEIYIRATGGLYSRLCAEASSSIVFNPFFLEDTPSNRAFLTRWMAQLVLEPHETSLPADINTVLSECVDYAYDQLDQSHRYLSSEALIE